MSESEIDNETSLDRARRKRDQCWEMAGCARQDGDKKEEDRYTEEARAWARKAAELSHV